MMHSLFSQVGLALLVAVSVVGLVLGGWRERFVTVVVLAGAAASMSLPLMARGPPPPGPLTAIDACVLIALVRGCWGSRRLWPYVAVALQGAAMALHGMRALHPLMDPWVYLTTLGLLSDGVLLALALGIWGHVRSPWRD